MTAVRLSHVERAARRRDIVAKAAGGADIKALVDEFGLCEAHIRQFCNSAGIHFGRKPRSKQGPRISSRDLEMIKMFQAGMVLDQIAEHFAVSHQYVSHRFKRLGVGRSSGGKAKRAAFRRQQYRDLVAQRFFNRWGVTIEMKNELVKQYGLMSNPNSPFAKYRQQKNNANRDRIAWAMTFAEWWQIWLDSGMWGKRGPGGVYCMARIGNVGPYSKSNVKIVTIGQNFSESFAHVPAHVRAEKAAITRMMRRAA